MYSMYSCIHSHLSEYSLCIALDSQYILFLAARSLELVTDDESYPSDDLAVGDLVRVRCDCQHVHLCSIETRVNDAGRACQ